MCWAQRQAENAEWEEKQTEAALGAYANLQEHIFTLYTRLFPTYEWVDPTAAVAVMHGEIERLREDAGMRKVAEDLLTAWKSEFKALEAKR